MPALQELARRSINLRVGATIKRANDPSGFLLITKAWGKAGMPNSTLKFRGLKLKFQAPGKPVPEVKDETIDGLLKEDWQLVGEETAERAALIERSHAEGIDTYKLSDKAVELAKQAQPPFDFTKEDTSARELSAAWKAQRKEALAATAAATTAKIEALAAARAAAKQKKEKAAA